MTKLFISYSRKDKEFAGRLNASLKEKGYDSWIDWDDIPPSADWWDQIQKGIEEADSFLFLISPDSIKSEVCGREIEHAVKNGKRMLPVVVRDVSPSDVNSVLAKLNWIFFREQDDFSSAMGKLEAGISTDLAWVEAHRRLQVKAREWEKRKDASLLLRGKDLQEAEHNLAANSSKEPVPTDLQRQYALASRQAADRQRRLVTLLSIAAAVIMAALAVFGFIQAGLAQERAIVARTRELAAQSITQRDSNFPAALLLGVEAQSLRDLPMTRGVLWGNTQTNLHLLQYLNQKSWVKEVAISPDGKILVSGTDEGSITLWDLSTRQSLGVLSEAGNGSVADLALSPDGRILASIIGGNVTLWDMGTRKQMGDPIPSDGMIRNLVFSPDGKILTWQYSRNFENMIQFWDVEAGELVGEPINAGLLGAPGESTFQLSAFDYSPDGRLLALGSYDGTVKFVDAATRQDVTEPIVAHYSPVTSIAFSPDGTALATGAQSGDIQLWNVQELQPLGNPLYGHDSDVNALAFSPDGKLLVSASNDASLILWDAETGKSLEKAPLVGHGSYVSDVAFSPDGKTLVSGGGDGNVILWTVEMPQTFSTDGQVESLSLSPDGKTLAAGFIWGATGEYAIRLLDPQTLQERCETAGTGFPTGLAYSPDGKLVAYGLIDDENNNIVSFLDSAACQTVGEPLATGSGSYLSLAFSPDGKLLAVSAIADGQLQFWDVASRQPLGDKFGGEQQSWADIAFSPDGSLLASGSFNDGTVILWDVASHEPQGEPLSGQWDVTSLAFSPDGKLLASGSGDKTIALWNVAQHQQESLIRAFGEVTSLEFSPDGTTLAAGNQEGTVVLVDLATSQTLSAPFKRHSDQVTGLVFSRDGKTLISGSVDGTIQLWDIDLDSMMKSACQRAGRNLTSLEWAQFGFTDEYHATCPQWPLKSQ